MKFYTIDIITLKIKHVADSSEELIDRINNETIDVENNWLADERDLDQIIIDKYAYYKTDVRRIARSIVNDLL